MEAPVAAAVRELKRRTLAKHYPKFIPFLVDGMRFLGFNTSDLQKDIADFLENGPDSLLIQAQRGQAKTTIVALFSVWTLIHHPNARIIITSAGATQATEISTLIVRIIMRWDILECLRPDPMAGDKTSVEHFDVHHSLKGVDRSPSVACFGIGANMQGKRADLLIADDVESSKNSRTAVQRAQLVHQTLDFASILMGRENLRPRVIWLGTPQSTDSIYNGLPGKGVTVRVWPGRYPTPEQLPNYGPFLAPYIRERLEKDPSLQTGGGPLGDLGQPTDPSYLGEQVLQRKALEQGMAYFELQHMLSTKLSDAAKYPLKTNRLLVMRLNKTRMVPLSVIPSVDVTGLRQYQHGDHTFFVNTPIPSDVALGRIESLHMYVDPAPGGANGDETGYCVSGVMNGNLYLFDVGGIPGGYELDKMERLAQIAAEWEVNGVTVEKNMGYGAFTVVWLPVLRRIAPKATVLPDDLVTGQKETRIASVLEPILGRGSLIINEDVIESDWATAQRYASHHAVTYTFFHQLAKLTRDRNSLMHDDRLDAVSGAARFWQKHLAADQERANAEAERAAYRRLTEDPLGYKKHRPPTMRMSILQRRLGRR
jgi:hypothetical protein